MRYCKPETKLRALTFLTGILLAATTLPGYAQVLDQEQAEHPYSFNGDATWARWQQEITVGIAGPLAGIELYIYEEGGAPVGDAVVYINVGPPWQYDTHDFELFFDPPGPGWNYIDTSSAGLVFDVDDKFVIGIQGTDDNLWFGGSSPSPGGPYDRGVLWSEGSPYQDGQYDMAFRTYVGEADIPGDLNDDGCVDQVDLGILLADWGCTGGDCPGDCDGDGDTDHSDLGILLAHWGEGCP